MCIRLYNMCVCVYMILETIKPSPIFPAGCYYLLNSFFFFFPFYFFSSPYFVWVLLSLWFFLLFFYPRDTTAQHFTIQSRVNAEIARKLNGSKVVCNACWEKGLRGWLYWERERERDLRLSMRKKEEKKTVQKKNEAERSFSRENK